MSSPFYGPKVFVTDDPAGEWEQATGIALPEGGEKALERIWILRLGEADGQVFAGGDPGVLFESRDGGTSFELNRALWEHPTRPKWQPGGGGLCLHSIETWPGEPDRLAIAISAAGVWLTDDGGAELAQGQRGPAARATCRRTRPRTRSACACTGCAATRGSRSGSSCSSTAASTAPTTRARAGATSRPGCPRTSASRSPSTPPTPTARYVIPLVADMDRVTPEGRVRVYETRDAGASWAPRGDGLPERHAYLTILREAFERTGEGDALELYFGSTSGAVFGSGDAGESWFDAAANLPPVYSVAAS